MCVMADMWSTAATVAAQLTGNNNLFEYSTTCNMSHVLFHESKTCERSVGNTPVNRVGDVLLVKCGGKCKLRVER